MKIKYGVIIGVVAIIFGFGSVQAQEKEYHIPAPTIVEVSRQADDVMRPEILGVTFNQTLVDVYIDGIFYGRAQTQDGSEGVASFSYRPVDKLSPGEHRVTTIARSQDETVRSQESEAFIFNNLLPTPPPYLLEPEIQDDGLVKIIGLLKNDLTVEIYIEGTKQVSFEVPPHKSGTTNFWYRPHLPAGEYTVTARALDNTGKASVMSNSIVMYVPKPDEVMEQMEDQDTMSQEDVVPTETITIKEDEEPVVKEDEEKEVMEEVKQSDEFEETTVGELEENLPDKPVVVEPDDADASVVVDMTEPNEGAVTIEESADDSEIAINQEMEEMAIVTDTDQDDNMVFGEKQEIGDGAEEFNVENEAEQVQQRNRIAGFIILLVIAIVLAIWYVREKKQAEKETDKKKD